MEEWILPNLSVACLEVQGAVFYYGKAQEHTDPHTSTAFMADLTDLAVCLLPMKDHESSMAM